jgi:hypothetical protein
MKRRKERRERERERREYPQKLNGLRVTVQTRFFDVFLPPRKGLQRLDPQKSHQTASGKLKIKNQKLNIKN